MCRDRRCKLLPGSRALGDDPGRASPFGAGLNISAVDINGKLHLGLTSCPELLPDLCELADGFDWV